MLFYWAFGKLVLNTESEIQSEIKTKLLTGTFLYLPQPNQLQHLQLENGAQPKCKLNNNNVNWCTKSRTIFGSLRDSGTKALFKLELKAACAKLSQDEAAAGPEEQTKTSTATCNVQQAANKHTHTLMSLAFANSFSSFSWFLFCAFISYAAPRSLLLQHSSPSAEPPVPSVPYPYPWSAWLSSWLQHAPLCRTLSDSFKCSKRFGRRCS